MSDLPKPKFIVDTKKVEFEADLSDLMLRALEERGPSYVRQQVIQFFCDFPYDGKSEQWLVECEALVADLKKFADENRPPSATKL